MPLPASVRHWLCTLITLPPITRVLLHYRLTHVLQCFLKKIKINVKVSTTMRQARAEAANQQTLLGNGRDFNLKIPQTLLSIFVWSQMHKGNFPALLLRKLCKKLFSWGLCCRCPVFTYVSNTESNTCRLFRKSSTIQDACARSDWHYLKPRGEVARNLQDRLSVVFAWPPEQLPADN